jgi:hypothetical protein
VTLLRVMWPIVDETVPVEQILAEARADLPELAARAHAQIVGPAQIRVLPSRFVPGCGGVSQRVLLLEAPAVEVARYSDVEPANDVFVEVTAPEKSRRPAPPLRLVSA